MGNYELELDNDRAIDFGVNELFRGLIPNLTLPEQTVWFSGSPDIWCSSCIWERM